MWWDSETGIRYVYYNDGNSSQWVQESYPAGGITNPYSQPFSFANTNASTSTSTGAITVSGGVGISGNVYAGGELYVTGTAWTSYNPSWTASGTAPVLGDGQLTGKYKQIGKTVFVRVHLVLGSSTTTGTGNWRFSLPVAAAASDGVVMPATYLDNTVNWHIGVVTCEYDGSTAYVVPLKGTSPSGAVNATDPFTWGTGDALTFNGSYEIA
jgi:hypothetical protein